MPVHRHGIFEGWGEVYSCVVFIGKRYTYGIQYVMTKICRVQTPFQLCLTEFAKPNFLPTLKDYYPCFKLVWLSGSEHAHIREFSDNAEWLCSSRFGGLGRGGGVLQWTSARTGTVMSAPSKLGLGPNGGTLSMYDTVSGTSPSEHTVYMTETFNTCSA